MMSARILSSESQIITMLIEGKLTAGEFASIQQSLRSLLVKHGKSRILVLAEGFAGVQPSDDGSDTSFRVENGGLIERVAIIGEKKWEDLAAIFTCKSVRKSPVEFFQPAELRQARAWLEQVTRDQPGS